jgi:hypothetical protein
MDDLDGSRPVTLVMTLLADGNEVTSVVLNEDNAWTAEVTDLPMYNGNNLIEYTWEEEFVPGYLMSEMRTLGNATFITNSHIPEFTYVVVRKVWQDRNNAAGRRPTSLFCTLSNGTIVELNAANEWTATVENLPKYYKGEEIVYTWREQEVLGYRLTSTVVEGNVTTFTNYLPERPPEVPVEEYETPLGLEVIINHVGDCFD